MSFDPPGRPSAGDGFSQSMAIVGSMFAGMGDAFDAMELKPGFGAEERDPGMLGPTLAAAKDMNVGASVLDETDRRRVVQIDSIDAAGLRTTTLLWQRHDDILLVKRRGDRTTQQSVQRADLEGLTVMIGVPLPKRLPGNAGRAVIFSQGETPFRVASLTLKKGAQFEPLGNTKLLTFFKKPAQTPFGDAIAARPLDRGDVPLLQMVGAGVVEFRFVNSRNTETTIQIGRAPSGGIADLQRADPDLQADPGDKVGEFVMIRRRPGAAPHAKYLDAEDLAQGNSGGHATIQQGGPVPTMMPNQQRARQITFGTAGSALTTTQATLFVTASRRAA